MFEKIYIFPFMTKSKVFSGTIWSAVQRFGTMAISFVANMILARLLTPDDFGTVGMLLFFVAIANTFVDSGFGSALIQKKEPSANDYSTVFITNLILSVILYVVLFFAAPLIASFYKIPILCSILRVEGLVLLINAMTIVHQTILRKRFQFKKLSIANLGGTFVGTIIGICFAYYGYGVWSLVYRLLAVSLVTTVLLWILNDWSPSFKFSITSFKELFGFGGFILLSSIITTIGNNIQTLIIGKFFQPSSLGHYTQAKQLRDVSSMSISAIVSQVIYTNFSEIQNDVYRLGRHLLLSVSIMSFLVTPLMGLFILISEPLIILLYSDTWLQAIPYFKVLCIGGIFLSLQDVNYYLVAAVGKSKIIFYANSIQVLFSILSMIVGSMLWNMMGLMWAMVFSSFLFYCVYALIASKQSDTNVLDQLKLLGRHIIQSVISYVISYIILNNIHTSNFVVVLTGVVVYITIYLILAFVTKSDVLKYLISIVKKV